MDDFTQQGIAALKAGDKTEARKLLTQAVRQDKQDMLAWYALSFAVDKQKDQVFCLQQVLQLDPNHAKAQQRLSKITAQTQPVEPETNSVVEEKADEKKAETAVVTQSEQAADTPPPQTTTDRLKQAFLGEPYLPKILTFLAILILLSDSLVILIGQAASYWYNFTVGSTFFPWLTPLIRIHPLLFAAAVLGIALIFWLATRYLSYKLAIILWMVMSYQHLRSFVAWSRCSLENAFSMTSGTCTAVDVSLTIAAGILLGIALAFTLLPRGISQQVWERTSTKIPRISKPIWIISGVWLTILLGILLWIVVTPPEGWIMLNVENSPPGRVNAGIAYDTDRQRAVIFGGGTEFLGDPWYNWQPIGDTWEWDGDDWHQFTPQTSPSPRLSSTMAYDPKRQVVVLFGGITPDGALGDTWEWDGQQWQQKSPANSPTGVCCAAMFYDSERERIILQGGYGGGDYFLAENWEWDGNNWQTAVYDPDTPQGANFPFAYEHAREQAVGLFPVWGTYTFYEQKWQRILPVSEMPDRTDAAMAYDPNHNLTILFGGTLNNDLKSDTWQFDGATWQQLTLPANGAAVNRHMMFYDETRESIIIFGGDDGNGASNAMWELHLP